MIIIVITVIRPARYLYLNWQKNNNNKNIILQYEFFFHPTTNDKKNKHDNPFRVLTIKPYVQQYNDVRYYWFTERYGGKRVQLQSSCLIFNAISSSSSTQRLPIPINITPPGLWKRESIRRILNLTVNN